MKGKREWRTTPTKARGIYTSYSLKDTVGSRSRDSVLIVEFLGTGDIELMRLVCYDNNVNMTK